jgi:hypothetical protein
VEARPTLSDRHSWDDVKYYSTIQAAVANNKLFLLARANTGIQTWTFNADSEIWSHLVDAIPRWSDDLGWDDVDNYSTVQTAVVNNELHLLARANAGIHTWKFDENSNSWSQLADNSPELSDGLGWDDISNYSTIQTVVVNNELFLLARANAGIHTWKFTS